MPSGRQKRNSYDLPTTTHLFERYTYYYYWLYFNEYYLGLSPEWFLRLFEYDEVNVESPVRYQNSHNREMGPSLLCEEGYGVLDLAPTSVLGEDHSVR